MDVAAHELRIRVRLRHQDGRRAVTATHISDPGSALEFRLGAIERERSGKDLPVQFTVPAMSMLFGVPQDEIIRRIEAAEAEYAG